MTNSASTPQPAQAARRPATCPLGTSACEIAAAIGDVPYVWDVASDRLSWGTNVAAVLGFEDRTLLATGRGFATLMVADNVLTRFDAVMKSSVGDTGAGVPYAIQYAIKPPSKDGCVLWLEDVGRWFAGARGEPVRALGMIRVVNERRAHEQRLAYLSRFDGLTGEMNRSSLTEALASTIEETIKLRSASGFLLIGMDDVERINDAYGFEVADEVIAAVAKRLRSRMRGGDHLGRFAGKKFGVILKQCTPDDMRCAAERLLDGVRDGVVQTKAGPVAVTASIGGVTIPRHARTVEEVLARAKEALDAANGKRTGSFQAYQPNVERDAFRRASLQISDEIVRALAEQRVSLAYEPVVHAGSRAPAFYEALMRIRRADGAPIPAGEVAPIAERLGLMRLLDQRVLELLLDEMRATPTLAASVNVSPASAFDTQWWSTLSEALRRHPDVAPRLIVEITETAAIQDIDDAKGFVARAKDLGCRIAIDDFGAGYTSFRSLRKLGVDVVKIDGAFVQNITRSEDDRAFVQTFLDLARRLGLATVAEWVQDEATADLLTQWGCDHLQGSLVGLARMERPWAISEPV